MISLFDMFVHSVADDDVLKSLKRHLYNLLYVDNGAVTSNTSLSPLYEILLKIFAPYGFTLQEFATNDKNLISDFPSDFATDSSVTNGFTKLLGMQWNKNTDTLSPPKFHLDSSADTKRKVLSSIASNYDIFNIGRGPYIKPSASLYARLAMQFCPKMGF